MKMFRSMLGEGVFLPPPQFETNFISFAHTDEDMEVTLDVYEKSLRL
ncbi:MAG: hypothetical protein SVM80_12870 [Halobacteriota archaeon]|nr:hypothetical protein [Halobacteriota archaeon]